MKNSLKEPFEKTLKDLVGSNKFVLYLLEKISGVDPFGEWISAYDSVSTKENIECFFKSIDTNVKVHWNIPPEKQCIFAFNHPTGPFDGMFVHKTIHTFNLKAKLIGEEIMGTLDVLRDCYIPISFRSKNKKQNIIEIVNNEIKKGYSIALFPGGTVAKKENLFNGINEYPWKKGVLRFAKENNLQIVPCFTDAELSLPFYLFKKIHSDLATLILFRENLKAVKKYMGKTVNIYVGDPILHENIEVTDEYVRSLQNICENLKYQVYTHNE